MRTRFAYIIGLLILSFHGCIKEHEEEAGSERAIHFRRDMLDVTLTANDEQGVATRSGNTAPPNETNRIFLGIAGKDSLFLSATESAPFPEAAATRSEGVIADSFHLSAYLDESTSPYFSGMIESEDDWATYSPMLYWPYSYNHISFIAYNSDLGNPPVVPEISHDGEGSASFSYSLAATSGSDNDAGLQHDLIFALAAEKHEDDGTVSMNFFHPLSAVEFKVGQIGDATILKATVDLAGVLSEGECTVTAPVSAGSIVWSDVGTPRPYSQTIAEGEAFKFIPQTLGDDTKATFSLLIGDITHTLPAVRLKDLTDEWKPNTRYTYTITKGGEVKVDIRNETDQVKIQNSGFSAAYLRAVIVGYWSVVSEGKEQIVASWDINDSETGTLVRSADWDQWWVEKDGIYYYKTPVAAGAYTRPVFDSYELRKTTGPVSGSRLKISVAVQAVEEAKAAEVWPINSLTD